MKKSKKEGVLCGFIYHGQVIAPDGTILQEAEDRNIIPQVAVDFMAALLRGTGTPIANWYVGVYEGNYVPVSSATSAILQTGAQESTAYSESSRPVWVNTYDGVQTISNTASRAEFTFTADKTLYGGFLVSDPAKGGSSGTLLSIARYATAYTVPLGSTFRLAVSITLLPAS